MSSLISLLIVQMCQTMALKLCRFRLMGAFVQILQLLGLDQMQELEKKQPCKERPYKGPIASNAIFSRVWRYATAKRC